MLKKEILNFIKQRWSIDSNFRTGNCLWFAIILKIRFPSLDIYYLPIEGHFIVGKDNIYYDWSGELELQETPILFDYIKETDYLWYSHLIRDCFYERR
jgi:hypothetical protein